MSHHEGVSCDSCLKNNFRGNRYKCLICFDYDLCATCHDSGNITARHTTDHPMQCILARNDLDLYFAGELPDQSHSYTCPFCGKLGFTETSLYEHVNLTHTDSSTEVVCPICATLPGGEPNQITDDFLAHLNVEHRNNRELEEPHIVRIRSRHHVRGLNNNRSRRSQFLASNGTATTTTARDAIDPIAQLLSQLSDVRRVNNTSSSSSSGQNGGMMQLQFDRQSASNRLPIERIIRRHQQSSSQLTSSIGSTQHESLSNQQMPYMVLLDGSTTSPAASANSVPKSNSTGVSTQINKIINTKYLLSTYANAQLAESEKEKENLGTLNADRSIFVKEMIIASLSEPLNIDSILSNTKSTSEKVKLSSSTTSDQSLDQVNSEIKITKEEYCDSEAKDGNKSIDNLPSDTNAHVDNLMDKPDEEKPLSAKKPQIKCLESNLSPSLVGYTEHENVQQKSLPPLMGNNPNSPFIVSQAQIGHRNRMSKGGRPTSSITSSASLPPNLASLAIRSSLTQQRPGAIVVSPTGRRKVLKHSTEPPPN